MFRGFGYLAFWHIWQLALALALALAVWEGYWLLAVSFWLGL